MTPAARAVVVTYSLGPDLLAPCLASLAAQSDVALEVVVVDNGRSAVTEAVVRSTLPDATYLRPDRNLGFAGGVALGLSGNPHPAALLLNDDARAETGWAAALLERLDVTAPLAAGAVAAVTSLLLLDDGSEPPRVNSTGNLVRRDGSGHDRDWLVPLGSESPDGDVWGFCGGAAALRTDALEAVGGFDADLFLYYEDTDVSWKLRARGWRVEYCSAAVVHHRHASSSAEGSPLFVYQNLRNRAVVSLRHAPPRTALEALLRTLLSPLARVARVRRWDADARARARAARDVLRQLPHSLRGRLPSRSGASGAPVSADGSGPLR